jgi:hypothetical protein
VRRKFGLFRIHLRLPFSDGLTDSRGSCIQVASPCSLQLNAITGASMGCLVAKAVDPRGAAGE